MKSFESYAGREQTYLKHFVLERYLEKVAYHIGFFRDEFVYVDCFSGPWNTQDERFEDTSFQIALNILDKVRNGLAQHKQYPKIRCLFIEKNRKSFEALEKAISKRSNAKALHGEFLNLTDEILKYVGNAFAFFFIDPTGWTGFPLKDLQKVISHTPGEVLINFMFDFVNRFVIDPRDDLIPSFNELFGCTDWKDAIAGPNREDAILDYYQKCIKQAGGYPFATRTRILKPTKERAFFHLVYATRHKQGLIVFRDVERDFAREQERVRLTVQQMDRIAKTGQQEIFGATELTNEESFRRDQSAQASKAKRAIIEALKAKTNLPFDDALPMLLEFPLIWEKIAKDIVMELKAEGIIDIRGFTKGKDRTPKSGHVLVYKK